MWSLIKPKTSKIMNSKIMICKNTVEKSLIVCLVYMIGNRLFNICKTVFLFSKVDILKYDRKSERE